MQFSTKELQLQKTTKELHSECWPSINVYFYILLAFANEKINTDAHVADSFFNSQSFLST